MKFENLELVVRGRVVHGFGRGSRTLGFPTANLDMTEIAEGVKNIRDGIYYGISMLNGVCYMAVLSLGDNPTFCASKRSFEVHLLHEFPEDFYGERLHMMILGRIRDHVKFDRVEDLIATITSDIEYCRKQIGSPLALHKKILAYETKLTKHGSISVEN